MAFELQADLTPREGQILSKAVARAAALLGVDDEDLSTVLGIPGALIPRMRDGLHGFEPGTNGFDAAVLFVRLFRSLDAIVGGNTNLACAWLRNHNTAFNASPLEKIKNGVGLNEVVDYLDAQRAIV